MAPILGLYAELYALEFVTGSEGDNSSRGSGEAQGELEFDTATRLSVLATRRRILSIIRQHKERMFPRQIVLRDTLARRAIDACRERNIVARSKSGLEAELSGCRGRRSDASRVSTGPVKGARGFRRQASMVFQASAISAASIPTSLASILSYVKGKTGLIAERLPCVRFMAHDSGYNTERTVAHAALGGQISETEKKILFGGLIERLERFVASNMLKKDSRFTELSGNRSTSQTSSEQSWGPSRRLKRSGTINLSGPDPSRRLQCSGTVNVQGNVKQLPHEPVLRKANSID